MCPSVCRSALSPVCWVCRRTEQAVPPSTPGPGTGVWRKVRQGRATVARRAPARSGVSLRRAAVTVGMGMGTAPARPRHTHAPLHTETMETKESLETQTRRSDSLQDCWWSVPSPETHGRTERRGAGSLRTHTHIQNEKNTLIGKGGLILKYRYNFMWIIICG